jgi:hypothetical protein
MDHTHDHHGHDHHTHDHDGHDHMPGHNGAPADHLHSHPGHLHAHGGEDAETRETIEDLCAAFIDGFTEAADKVSFLRLAGVPFEMVGADGLAMKLVDVAIRTDYQVGTASPGFASRELVYLPFAGAMVRERTRLDLVYVSLTERRDVPLGEIIGSKHGPPGG